MLKGELHVIDIDPNTGEELSVKVRPAGDFASKALGDVHMERGGPKGALVFFSLYSEDGSLAETLARDGRVLSTSTIDPILQRHAS